MAIMSYVHEIETVYNVVQNPKMVLLSKNGAHGVSARCEKVCMLLPQRSQGSTLKNHMLFIANSTTVASQTNPASPVYMASTSQTASSNWQAMTAQPALRIETLVMSNESYVFPHGRNFVANSLVYPVNP